MRGDEPLKVVYELQLGLLTYLQNTYLRSARSVSLHIFSAHSCLIASESEIGLRIKKTDSSVNPQETCAIRPFFHNAIPEGSAIFSES